MIVQKKEKKTKEAFN